VFMPNGDGFAPREAVCRGRYLVEIDGALYWTDARWVVVAKMGQSTKSATIAANIAGGDGPWINPDSALIADGEYASVECLGDFIGTKTLALTGFGFDGPGGIPASATILGIKAEVLCSCDNASVYEGWITAVLDGARILDSNHARGPYMEVPWPTTPAYIEYGGADDLTWGALSAEDVRSVTFGLGVSVDVYDDTARVDHVRITVYYEQPLGGFVRRIRTQVPFAQQIDPRIPR
jgi:hypothetical protein